MTRAEILDKAKECVCGQREQDYGSPEDNFKLIAELWTEYLFHKSDKYDPAREKWRLIEIESIDSKDVAIMMALLKIARIATGTGTADSFVDLAGYAACAGEIATHDRGETDAR